MIYRNRQGEEIRKNEEQDKLLKHLYQTIPGRAALKLLVQPWVSKTVGSFLNSKPSAAMIAPFVEKHRIAMSSYLGERYESFNAFFHRRIQPKMRPINKEKGVLISPCDAKLSVYHIEEDSSFCIKNSYYTMERLVQNRKLARHYIGGTLLVFRLTVDDYHHFCYAAGGRKTKNVRIPGVLHTVNPIAQDTVSVYAENTREYSLLQTKEFGTILMMEVGALLVGKIVNLDEAAVVWRGKEKGWFEFGGSTVILCFPKDKIQLDEDIQRNNAEGIETIVKLGESIGKMKS